jgi:hypothetical protein
LQVIVGGTKDKDDWFVFSFVMPFTKNPTFFIRYPIARPETTVDILRRGLALCPELVRPEIRAERKPKLEDVFPLIIEEGCGLRPGRKGGIRLEVEWWDAGRGQGKVPVVFNYG